MITTHFETILESPDDIHGNRRGARQRRCCPLMVWRSCELWVSSRRLVPPGRIDGGWGPIYLATAEGGHFDSSVSQTDSGSSITGQLKGAIGRRRSTIAATPGRR